jgi:hypothetical protein
MSDIDEKLIVKLGQRITEQTEVLRGCGESSKRRITSAPDRQRMKALSERTKMTETIPIEEGKLFSAMRFAALWQELKR